MREEGGAWSSQAWLSWSEQEALGVGDTLQEVLMFAQKHDGEHGSQTLAVQIDSQQELKR